MALKVFIFLWMFFSTSNEVKLGECYSQYGANKQESIGLVWYGFIVQVFPRTQLSDGVHVWIMWLLVTENWKFIKRASLKCTGSWLQRSALQVVWVCFQVSSWDDSGFVSSTYVDSGKLADDITWDLISSSILWNLGLHLYFIFSRCETMAQDCLVLLFVCLFFFPSISLEQTTLCTNQISDAEVVFWQNVPNL